MNKINFLDKVLKFLIGWTTCFLIRLIPFKTPNIEPLLATQMPFAKKYGALYGFFFGSLSILLFDIVSQKVGIWTLITGVCYGLLGVFASVFFKKQKSTRLSYLKFAVVGTIFYDALTGLTIGPLMFHQSFMESLIGQIPFTAMHLLGNCILAVTLSPLVYKWIVTNNNLNFSKKIAEE